MTDQEIWYEADVYLCSGNEYLRRLVSIALSKVPDEIAESVLDDCMVLCCIPEEKGCYFPPDRFTGKHLILFAHTIFEEPEGEQINLILHEIAHFILKHSDPLNVIDGEGKEKGMKKEREADELAASWYSEYIPVGKIN